MTTINIPSSVTSISDEVFSGCTALSSIDIPNSVTKIGESAFEGCTGLAAINIPNSVRDIDYCAFMGCTGIKHITIPDSVNRMPGAFAGCTSLDDVIVPGSVTEMSYCFSGCTSLQSVKINAPVKSLEGVFGGCTSLKTVEIPETVEDLSYCFQYCGDIKVKISESVTNMASTFYHSDVTSVIFPKNVTNIEKCYAECRHITSANIPGSVKNATRAFEKSSITEANIEEGVEDVDGAFLDSDVKTITFPSTIKVLGLYPFYHCKELEEIRFSGPIPPMSFFGGRDFYNDNLTGLGIRTTEGLANYMWCDYKDRLSKLTFLNGYKEPEETSWKNCKNLKYIVAFDTIPPTLHDSFSEAQKWDIKIRVPSSALEAYKQAPVWKDFFFLSGGAETLGIEGINAGIEKEERVKPIFNLNGARVKEVMPGHIYIRDGKKFMAR